MADNQKAVAASQPETEKVELLKGENESVELSEEELENVAGAGPAGSDDG